MNEIILPNELTLPEIEERLDQEFETFLSSARTTVEAAWRGGGLLLQAKGRLPHGEFTPWIMARTRLSPRSARVWMRINLEVPETAVTAVKSIQGCLKLLTTTNKEVPDYSARDAKLLARAAELPKKTYHIILADPPWRYDHAPAGDPGRAIEANYPTMTMEELCNLNVAEIAAPDCLLYLWVTTPKLVEGMQLLEEWGFAYRTSLVWVKYEIGTGYHARSQHELMLIGLRGHMPPPAPELRKTSVIFAGRQEHSKKPDELCERIEAAYPAFNKIELFSREPRNGWDSWGFEAVHAA